MPQPLPQPREPLGTPARVPDPLNPLRLVHDAPTAPPIPRPVSAPVPSEPSGVGHLDNGWLRLAPDVARALFYRVGGYRGVLLWWVIERTWGEAWWRHGRTPDGDPPACNPVEINISAVARETGAHRNSIRDALRSLTADGVLVRDEAGRVSVAKDFNAWKSMADAPVLDYCRAGKDAASRCRRGLDRVARKPGRPRKFAGKSAREITQPSKTRSESCTGFWQDAQPAITQTAKTLSGGPDTISEHGQGEISQPAKNMHSGLCSPAAACTETTTLGAEMVSGNLCTFPVPPRVPPFRGGRFNPEDTNPPTPHAEPQSPETPARPEVSDTPKANPAPEAKPAAPPVTREQAVQVLATLYPDQAADWLGLASTAAARIGVKGWAWIAEAAEAATDTLSGSRKAERPATRWGYINTILTRWQAAGRSDREAALEKFAKEAAEKAALPERGGPGGRARWDRATPTGLDPQAAQVVAWMAERRAASPPAAAAESKPLPTREEAAERLRRLGFKRLAGGAA